MLSQFSKNHDFVYFASVDEDGVHAARLAEPVMDDKPGLRLVVSHAADNVLVKLADAHAELYRDGPKVYILYS